MISERSSLYSLEPMGIGTPYVESLSSYICRLAEAHNTSVSCLMKKKMFPELKSCPSILEGRKGRVFDGFQVNGLGITTLDFVNTLEKLTFRTDIHNLTLLNFTALFPNNARKLIVRKKRWCPSCFRESYELGKILYEPLLWQLEDYRKCNKHNCILQSKCRKCKKEVKSFFLKTTIIGHCPFCNIFLGKSDVLDYSFIEDKERLISRFYSEIFILNSTLKSFPTKYSIKQFIKKIEQSNIFRPYRSASEIFHFNDCALKSWITGVSMPNPYFWSIIKGFTNSSIQCIFLEKEIFKDLIRNLKYHLINNNHKRKVNYLCRENNSKETINKRLISYLDNADYSFGLVYICKKEGFSLTTARKYFPQLCDLIVEMHKQYKINLKEEIRKKISIIADDKETGHFSVKDVASSLGVSQSFIKENFPELNTILASKHIKFKKDSKKKRITELKQAIFEGILDLYNKGIYPSEDKILPYLPTNQKCVFLANPELREFKNLTIKNLFTNLRKDKAYEWET